MMTELPNSDARNAVTWATTTSPRTDSPCTPVAFSTGRRGNYSYLKN